MLENLIKLFFQVKYLFIQKHLEKYEARKNKKKKLEEIIAPVNVNKAACSKPVLGEMERKIT